MEFSYRIKKKTHAQPQLMLEELFEVLCEPPPPPPPPPPPTSVAAMYYSLYKINVAASIITKGYNGIDRFLISIFLYTLDLFVFVSHSQSPLHE